MCVTIILHLDRAQPARRTDFIITTSVDGHLKLWQKQEVGIEFVKHFRAHIQPIVGISCSADGSLFASISEDGTAKVFDILNFGALNCINIAAVANPIMLDMINMLKFDFTPHACCWVHRKGQAQALLAV